jgi:hypothetical protein
MQRHVIAVSMLVTAAAARGLPAQEFEGTITMRQLSVPVGALHRQTGGDPDRVFALDLDRLAAVAEQVENVTMYIKGAQMRTEGFDEAGEGGYMTVDWQRGIFRTVQPTERTYLEWSVADLEAIQQEMRESRPEQDGDAPEAAGPDPTLHPLNQARIVSGIRCDGYEVRTEGAITRAWVTQEHPAALRAFRNFLEQAQRMNPSGAADARAPNALVASHGFPMLTQTLHVSGSGRAVGVYNIQEIVSVSAGGVPDKLFSPPAGYRKMSLADVREQTRPDGR